MALRERNNWINETYSPSTVRELAAESEWGWLGVTKSHTVNAETIDYTYTFVNQASVENPKPAGITHLAFYHLSTDVDLPLTGPDSIIDILADFDAATPGPGGIDPQLPTSFIVDPAGQLTLASSSPTYVIYELTPFSVGSSFTVSYTVPRNDQNIQVMRMGFLTGDTLSDLYPGGAGAYQVAYCSISEALPDPIPCQVLIQSNITFTFPSGQSRVNLRFSTMAMNSHIPEIMEFDTQVNIIRVRSASVGLPSGNPPSLAPPDPSSISSWTVEFDDPDNPTVVALPGVVTSSEDVTSWVPGDAARIKEIQFIRHDCEIYTIYFWYYYKTEEEWVFANYDSAWGYYTLAGGYAGLIGIDGDCTACEGLPPTASFTSTLVDEIPLTVDFDASASSDPDGTIVSYGWEFGDGSTGSGETVQYTYTSPGTYNVMLTVTDNDGFTDTLTVSVTVALDFQLTWWEPGSKVYERGVDRGVLYLKDGRVVPWSGLTAVDESAGRSTDPVYFDGVKLSEVVNNDGFSAKVSAITYPPQLEETYGNLKLRNGVYLGEQAQKTFGFCYRSKLGTELDEDAGYKLHIIYNITALPDDVSYNTISDDPSLTEFGWEFKTTPETAPGYRPSAYVVLNSMDTTPSLLAEIESILYGTQGGAPYLPPLSELLDIINGFNNFINIIDNGDGTWTASTSADGYINDLDGGVYEIREANIQYTSTESYLISPTSDPPTFGG